jgi:4-amino-4-deoxy-L-arabinose transferase-like glycosyltransferase
VFSGRAGRHTAHHLAQLLAGLLVLVLPWLLWLELAVIPAEEEALLKQFGPSFTTWAAATCDTRHAHTHARARTHNCSHAQLLAFVCTGKLSFCISCWIIVSTYLYGGTPYDM